MLSILVPLLADFIAITCIITFYFRRHQRRDLMLAYAALNAGVLAVTTVLASAPVGAGLGLGLFGVLSIIRLRSDSITQAEIAYYFIALALGLITGIHAGPIWVAPALAATLVLVMFVVDHPRTLAATRRQVVTFDEAIADEDRLRARLEHQLNADVRRLIIEQTDYVRDLTVVDVRYRRRTATVRHSRRAGSALPGLASQPEPELAEIR